ncbi:MAG: phosphoribosylaminoimidazolesuccinocarboxamide synthase [Patescibacteria group bacterium]|nr:phosphoribosylaminoimidazolesuccinocarboxamide synthase [Patescibacteria group bacterium]MDE1965862.1 phosphoribosylaminoimidazolesuccinocarboxamide synthase [Patescibacteria group bacterium]
MQVLKETDFKEFGERKKGKVRDIYFQPERLILITTDRLTGFDRFLACIPNKGAVLNLSSAFWFDATKDIVPNHIIAVPDPNVTVAKRYEPLKIEGVVRGYLTGSTDTSIWTRYGKGERTFGGITLPDGLAKNTKLPQAIFDPTTKEDVHDRALTPDELVAEGFITKELFEKVQETALKLFKRGQDVAAKHGLILVDTKYEFGTDENGELVLIDEIHTPDSSRYWQLATYGARMAKGEAPEHFDKEFIRLWFKEHSDPYKDEVLPEAPTDLIEELSRRYIAIYEQLSGKAFPKPSDEPIEERIRKNLVGFTL